MSKIQRFRARSRIEEITNTATATSCRSATGEQISNVVHLKACRHIVSLPLHLEPRCFSLAPLYTLARCHFHLSSIPCTLLPSFKCCRIWVANLTKKYRADEGQNYGFPVHSSNIFVVIFCFSPHPTPYALSKISVSALAIPVPSPNTLATLNVSAFPHPAPCTLSNVSVCTLAIPFALARTSHLSKFMLSLHPSPCTSQPIFCAPRHLN